MILKMKHIIKNIRDFILYIIMFLLNKIIGVKTNKIVFISFGGKSYSDNPRAISENLKEKYSHFKIIWLINNPYEKKDIIPNNIKVVKKTIFSNIYHHATAKLWIDNFCKPLYFYKSVNQIYIQTWHGDRGFKTILHDSPFWSKKQILFETANMDLAVSGSKYNEMQYRSAFKYKGKILKKGYPRNDILISNSDYFKKVLKDQIIKNDYDVNILLFAPTLRRDASINNKKQKVSDIDIIKTLQMLEYKTKKQWICLTRAHSAVMGITGIPQHEKIIDISRYEDMSHILLISDFLITDYSSSAGDFALLNKPIILFQNDREEYLKKDRSFYFDIDKSPFMVAKSQNELNNMISNLNFNEINQNCEDILKFYGTYETGKASEFVVEYIYNKYLEGKNE